VNKGGGGASLVHGEWALGSPMLTSGARGG
jgi:hypothetical protein